MKFHMLFYKAAKIKYWTYNKILNSLVKLTIKNISIAAYKTQF